MVNNSPPLFAMKVSLLSIRTTQNTAKNKQGKNSLQHPDAPSATSYWFSGALLVDLSSKEQTLRCLYNLRISTKWDWVSQKQKAKWEGHQCNSIGLGGGEKSYPFCSDTAGGQTHPALLNSSLLNVSCFSLSPHPVPLFRLSWQWALGWGCTLWPSVSD